MDTRDLLVNTTSHWGWRLMQIVNVNLTKIPLILVNVRTFATHGCHPFIVIVICFNFLLVILTRTFMSYICCTSFPLTSTLQVVGGLANNGFSKKILHVLGSIFSRLQATCIAPSPLHSYRNTATLQLAFTMTLPTSFLILIDN